MKIRGNKTTGLYIGAIIAIAIFAVTAIRQLDSLADHAYDHEIILLNIKTRANLVSALEWQMIAAAEDDPALAAEAGAVRNELDTLLAEHGRFEHATDTGRRTNELIDEYLDVLERESMLISAGEIGAALRVDGDERSPLFTELEDAVDREAQALHDDYNMAHRLYFLGTLAVITCSLSLILLLLWRRRQHQLAEKALMTEMAVLEESEERFRAVAQSAPDAIISVNSLDRITFWNDSAERIFAYPAEEILGKPLTTIMPERFREEHRAAMGRIVTGGEQRLAGKTVQFTGLRREGGEFPVELTLSSWSLEGEQFYTAVLRDISDRVSMEQKVRSQQAKLAAGNAQLWALYETSVLINYEEQLDVLFDKVLERITSLDVFNIERKGGIFLVDGDRMRLASWLDHSDAFLKLHNDIKVGTCLCGLAAATGETIVSADSGSDSRHDIRYPGMLPHGHVIVPLKTGEEILGVLYLYLPVDGKMSDEDLNLLEAIGNQLAVAVKKHKLFEEARDLSLHDPLTGLANRNLMNIELSENMARLRRFTQPFSVLMLDLDHFKTYNDTYGHKAGDRLLVEVAEIIMKEVREVDLAARYGGEEFLVILPETDEATALRVAERIREQIEQREFYRAGSAAPARITVSIGVAGAEGDIPNEDVIVARADDALYQAKSSGRNRVDVWRPTRQAA